MWGNWADLPARPTAAAQHAVRGHIGDVLRSLGDDKALAAQAHSLQVRYALDLTPEQMGAFVADPSQPDVDRIAVLDQLAAAAPDRVPQAVTVILEPKAGAHGALRRRAYEMLAKADPAKAVDILSLDVSQGDVDDRQRAVAALAAIDTPAAHAAIGRLADDMRAGALDRRVALDLYEAAMTLPSSSPERQFVEQHAVQGKRPPGYATALVAAGGDAAAGRDIFLHHPSASACAATPSMRSAGTPVPT